MTTILLFASLLFANISIPIPQAECGPECVPIEDRMIKKISDSPRIYTEHGVPMIKDPTPIIRTIMIASGFLSQHHICSDCGDDFLANYDIIFLNGKTFRYEDQDYLGLHMRAESFAGRSKVLISYLPCIADTALIHEFLHYVAWRLEDTADGTHKLDAFFMLACDQMYPDTESWGYMVCVVGTIEAISTVYAAIFDRNCEIPEGFEAEREAIINGTQD